MNAETKHFFYKYDLDAATYKYGRLGDGSGYPIPGQYGGVTVGANTTVTGSLVGGVAAKTFSPVTAGDIIVFKIPPDTASLRKVATKVSASEITIDTAIDLGTTGRMFDFLPFKIGAVDGSGWHSVRAYAELTVWLKIGVLASAPGIDFTIEMMSGGLGSPIVTILPTTSYTAVGTYSFNIGEVGSQLRVGLKATAAFAGTDEISVWMTGRMRTA